MSQDNDQRDHGSAGYQAPSAGTETEQASNGEFVPSASADPSELAQAEAPVPAGRRASEPGGVTKASDVDDDDEPGPGRQGTTQ
jgi:hypothetical protein